MPEQRRQCCLSLRQWVALCNQNSFGSLLFHCLHFPAWWGLSRAVSRGREHGFQHLEGEVPGRGARTAKHRLPGRCCPGKIRKGKVTLKAEPGLGSALHRFFVDFRSKKCPLGKIEHGCYFVDLFSGKTQRIIVGPLFQDGVNL